jgi:hypothetical protein
MAEDRKEDRWNEAVRGALVDGEMNNQSLEE